MSKIVNFKDIYTDGRVNTNFILVKSESSDKIYKVRCGPYECSCPAYQRFSSPFVKAHGYGPEYICKHMRKIINMQLPVDTMLSVIKATNGDIDIFVKNFSQSQLLILYFRQLIYFKSNNEVGVLE